MRALLTVLLLAGLALAGGPGAAVAAKPIQDAGQNNQAVQAYDLGDYETAAFLFADLAEHATSEEIRLRSEYYLAQSLLKRGLYDAALQQFSYVIKAGPNHPHYLRAVEGVVVVSEALQEDFITGTLLDKEYNDEFAKLPIEALNKINYVVGMVSYRKNKREEAMSFFVAVPPDSSYFARARYMQGILAARDAKSQEALEAFAEVARLENTPKRAFADLETLKHLAILASARVFYGMGRFADAVKYYEQIPRFSEFWDEALFENGWARFQNDDYGGALGSLQALHAPQFAGSFQPESWILKATVYYYYCLFDDAKDALAGFEKSYLPISEALKPMLEGERDNEYFHSLLTEKSELPPSVRNYLLANKRLVQFKAYADQLDREKAVIQAAQGWKGSRLQEELLGSIDRSRDLAAQLTGSFVKSRLDDVAKTILGFDGRKEIIKFEVARGETELLERRADQQGFLAGQAIYRPEMPGTNWEYWQFQGEFWLDEVGYYQYTLKSGCMKQEE